MSSRVDKDIELKAVCRQFEPYLTTGCVCILVVPLWCDLRCYSQAVVVIQKFKLLQKPAFLLYIVTTKHVHCIALHLLK